MTSKKRTRSLMVGFGVVLVACLVVFYASPWSARDTWAREDEPAGHDHSVHEAAQAPDAHDDHDAEHADEALHLHEAESAEQDDHDAHDAHGDHDAGHSIPSSEEEAHALDIELQVAAPGRLIFHRRLPGEIKINADRVAHIVPRAPGIVREVLKSVGDPVQAGEVMAWLESVELGEAKIDYLAKWAELGCCTFDLTRAREIHDNTLQFLELLAASPSVEQLRQANGTAMGENRSALVSAYAGLIFARTAYEREKPLYEKKISSGEDFLAAESAYKKADADYAATVDSVGFNVRRAFLEAKREQQLREMEWIGAKRRLQILGLSAGDIEQLEAVAKLPSGSGEEEADCDDPNCEECKAEKQKGGPASSGDPVPSINPESLEKLAWYPLRAPFDGTVIERHVTLGEKLDEEADPFTIADLRSVWVDVSVYQKDLPHVRKGERVAITSVDSLLRTEGVIALVSPLVDPETRTALARIELPNSDGSWRPGLFVEAELSQSAPSAGVLVPKGAVQRVGQDLVVFVESGEALEPVPVSIGRSTDSHVEILSGLKPGQHYVARGAFDLKAKQVTSGLGAHAGHGH